MHRTTIRHYPCLAAAAAALLLAAPVVAPAAHAGTTSTIDFAWQGDAHYRAQGRFTYDNTVSIIDIDAATNIGPLDAVYDLSIAFYDPADTLLFQTDVVTDRMNEYVWLELHFDTATQSFFDRFDIGADEMPGDHYLAGTIGGKVSLIESLNPQPLDSSSTAGSLTVTPVTDNAAQPIAAPTPAAFAAGAICLLALTLRRRRWEK